MSEIAVIGRPALLVPYPHALDHDQAANAAALAAAGGAEVHPQSTLSPERIAELLGGLMDDPDRLAAMAAAAQVGRQAGCGAVARRSGRGYCVEETVSGIQEGDAPMKMPQTIGLVHFIGIGGIGMSGIAEVLHNLGYRVQGSDQADSANVQRLRDKGIECFVGHSAENLGDAEVVVVSTAIKKTNPELMAAREKLLPIVRRAEMLAELMRFRQAIAIGGTHGKTTTTSMVATLLEAGGLDPTVINGGIINAYGTNARMGEGEWMVVEADESDGTFLKLPADIAVVTNIDPEHLDHYGTFDKVREAFRQFVENVPFYGFGVMCTDHPEVQALVGRIEDRRVITYGENAQADVRFTNHPHGRRGVDVRRRDPRPQDRRAIRRSRICVCRCPAATTSPTPPPRSRSRIELGMSAEDITKGLVVLRRRQAPLHADRRAGTASQVFDDYGHHPVEIKAVLKAARDACQGPRHRHCPAASLHAAARPVRRVLRLLQRCRHGHGRAGLCGRRRADRGRQLARRWCRASAPAAIATRATSRGRRRSRRSSRELAKPGDFVVFLGAGNITQWAYALPKELGGEAA